MQNVFGKMFDEAQNSQSLPTQSESGMPPHWASPALIHAGLAGLRATYPVINSVAIGRKPNCPH